MAHRGHQRSLLRQSAAQRDNLTPAVITFDPSREFFRQDTARFISRMAKKTGCSRFAWPECAGKSNVRFDDALRETARLLLPTFWLA